MSMSLRDQLLAAGLGSKQQAKRAEQEQRRDHKQARRGGAKPAAPSGPSVADAAERARAAKVARDRELEQRRQESADARARLGLVRQWADRDRLPAVDGGDPFDFVDGGKVRRLRVDATRRAQLLRSEVIIVRVGDRYELLPAAAAERIRARVPEAVIDLPAPAAPGSAAAGEPGNDDPYKDYVVPDDLVW